MSSVEQLGVGDARRLEELRVDARRREAGDRVDLVDHDLAVGADEEVDAGHPLAFRGDERLDGEVAYSLVDFRRDPRRDHELHPALVVLRRVVVPLGVRHDLADDRRDRVAVPEHATLDLSSDDELLDQDLVVVPACKRDGGLELILVVRLRDSNRRSEAGGLHEDGVRERVLRRVAVSKRHVLRNRDPSVAKHRLEEILVHAQRRGSNAGADVGHACELEQPLHRAVLAERAVEDRQHDVDLAEHHGWRGVGDDRAGSPLVRGQTRGV